MAQARGLRDQQDTLRGIVLPDDYCNLLTDSTPDRI